MDMASVAFVNSPVIPLITAGMGTRSTAKITPSTTGNERRRYYFLEPSQAQNLPYPFPVCPEQHNGRSSPKKELEGGEVKELRR